MSIVCRAPPPPPRAQVGVLGKARCCMVHPPPVQIAQYPGGAPCIGWSQWGGGGGGASANPTQLPERLVIDTHM